MNNYLHGKWGLQPVRHCCKGSQIAPLAAAFIFTKKEGFKMKILMENWKRFVNEEEGVVSEAGQQRLAGLTTAYQILKLNPDFKFQKRPSNERLKIIQDIQDPNTGLVFDGEEMIGELDLTSSPEWFDRVLRFSPGEVDQTLEYYKGR